MGEPRDVRDGYLIKWSTLQQLRDGPYDSNPVLQVLIHVLHPPFAAETQSAKKRTPLSALAFRGARMGAQPGSARYRFLLVRIM